MIRNSIVAKLWSTIVVMVVVVLALLSILLQQFFDGYVVQEQSGELSRLAQSVEVLMQGRDPKTAARIAKQLASSVQKADVDVDIPYTSSVESKSRYTNFTPSQKRTFMGGQPVVIRGTVAGIDALSVYMKIPSRSGPPGMLDVSQSMSVLDEPLSRMRNLLFFATALGVVLATGLAFVVSKNLSRPLVQMNDVAEDMAKGNFERRVTVVTRDEVGRLGHTFNKLAKELSDTIRDLSVERDQLSSILASLVDGVVAADLAARVTLANPPALRRLRALSVAEGGAGDTERLPKRLHTFFETVVERKEAIYREVDWDGRHIALSMLPLFESGGTKLRGILAVLRDVTEERRLDRLRKDFIANVSHELRTPLSMMQGYAEALMDDIADDPTARRELTEIIYDESLRMKRLVNDLLDLAQLESGQFQMRFERYDLADTFRKVSRKFSAVADDRGVRFQAAWPMHPIVVDVDPDRIEQVLTNLLDNAFRHTSNGTVSLQVSVRSRYVHIAIQDTGSGIPKEDLSYIFERFYKADKARTRSKSGTGLGLAITHHIVLEHGGDVLVESELGKGTTFTVVLPIVDSIEKA